VDSLATDKAGEKGLNGAGELEGVDSEYVVVGAMVHQTSPE
jgi:hypothetical protein